MSTAGTLCLKLGEETLRVDFLTPGIVRVRRYRGETPPEQPLLRYGFFRDDWPEVEVDCTEEAGRLVARSELLTVALETAEGRLEVSDATGKVLLAESEPSVSDDRAGFRARFELPPERCFFGLGDQTRERLQHRGSLNDLWVRNVTGYIPIPFFSTDDGFGVMVNTTRRLMVDLGHTSEDWFGFGATGGGTLDYYVLYGPSLPEIITRYTDLTGKPPLPPKWALGLWFVCRTQANDREFLEDCRSFRDEEIPCDAIGLEPGWMDTNYDFTLNKDWSQERFPVPGYDRNPGRYTFLRAARRMGFKPGLWLCCDYDLSWEEERRVQARCSEAPAAMVDLGFEQDEHFSHARYLDTLTRPEEPWYQHLTDFVDQGVEWFKQDGANQVLDHPDRLYGNGMRDDEMHNLNPLLYSKQMYLGFAEHTGRRPQCFTPAGWAGLQRWTATWTGDTGGEEKPLAACLNLTLSGHGMTTCDMEVTTPQGIHFGFFLPWAQINSWNYFRHPWYQGEELQQLITDYAQLRYRLLPYLYSCCYDAHVTGVPWLRAMPLDYTADRETHGLLKQFMFGPAMMAAAFTDRVYLPEGGWYNFWTGELLQGPGWVTPNFEDFGGPLLVKAGAIIPMGPEIEYVGQEAEEQLLLDVYAGAAGEFTLYEDDGVSLDYASEPGRMTLIHQEPTANGLKLTVEPAAGTFPGAPAHRLLQLMIHGLRSPQSVSLNGQALSSLEHTDRASGWDWHEGLNVLSVLLGEQPVEQRLVVEVQ
jgi:alpha-glucosidase (family GH31 glycosyl hydrolase)